MPNLEPNFGPVRQSSGSNLSSEPNCGNPTKRQQDHPQLPTVTKSVAEADSEESLPQKNDNQGDERYEVPHTLPNPSMQR